MGARVRAAADSPHLKKHRLAMPIENPMDSWSHFDTVIPPGDFDPAYWLQAWDQEFLFYRVDRHARVVFVTPSVKNILGYTPDELLGVDSRTLFDVREPLPQFQDLVARMAGVDGRQLQPRMARRRDGEISYLLVRERPLVDHRGESVGIEVMAQDDTPRVLAEMQLRQSERKYQGLVEGLRGDYFLYTHDPGGQITYVSPSIQDVLGFPPAAVVGKNWCDFIEPDSLGPHDAEQVSGDVAREKRFLKLVIEVRRADGAIQLLEAQQRPVFDESGAYYSMEGIAKNITDVRRTQDELTLLHDELEQRVIDRTEKLAATNAQLRDSESRYRDLVEKQAEFIVRWGPDGRRRDVNEAYCRYLGKPREELIGKRFIPVIVKEDLPIFEAAIASLCPATPSVTYEHRVYRSDGKTSWTQWTETAFYDDDGNPVEYLSVGRDVTELKGAEDRLREKESHLAHISRLATLGELVAGIAHEVHQPLHAAGTFAEAARRHLESGRTGGTEAAVRCTREVANAIARTAKIIRRLRDFTREQPVKLELLDLNEVVREAAEIMAFATRRAGVFPQLDLADGLPQIRGDRIQLQQVCVNLIQNACDALAEVALEQRQFTIRTVAAAGAVAVEFSDSGKGVDDAIADQMFNAFFTTKPDGMGMGLSLCQSIAEAHGAELRAISSRPQPGVTMALTIPTTGTE